MPQSAAANEPYARLRRRIIAEGLLLPQPRYYRSKTAIALVLFAVSLCLPLFAPNAAVVAAAAVFGGFSFTQVALLSHDTGHRQAYRGRLGNRWARLVFGPLLLGVSASWWQERHNQHHATPNDLDSDPDIRIPIVVFAEEQIASQPRYLRWLTAAQAVVFPLLWPLQSVSMHGNGARYLLSARGGLQKLELAFFATHFALYGAFAFLLAESVGVPQALLFVAIQQGTFGLFNASVFASNHKGMELVHAGEGRGFLREQVLTSRNVHGRWYTDFWYGGLNYQIEHHLFPTMPRNNLCRAQSFVRALCEEEGIPYHATGIITAYREMFVHLHRASASLRPSHAGTAAAPSQAE